MFVPHQPIFLIAVDNYGLAVINLYTMGVSEMIYFSAVDTLFPSLFEITKVITLTEKALRVFIKDTGSFSMTWDHIELSQDNNLFRGVKFRDYAFDFQDRITTDLIATTPMGYAQIIYRRESRSFLAAYIRIFNEFNRFGSKILNEFSIGRVPL